MTMWGLFVFNARDENFLKNIYYKFLVIYSEEIT
jgi:hypothetical protein